MGTVVAVVSESPEPPVSQKWWHSLLFSAALFLFWGGMIAFGTVMDLNDETDTHDAFKIVATTGAMVGSVHVAWIAGRVARRTLVRRWDFLVLYSKGIRRCVSFAVFSAVAFACIQVSERMSSNHSPFETVTRVFYSGLVLTACFLALQTTGILIFTYVFFSHRKKVWGTISANEASIMDRPDISRAFSCADVCVGISESAPLGEFLHRWVGVSDADIIRSIPTQAIGLFQTLCALMLAPAETPIRKEEFLRFMDTRSVHDDDERIENLWMLLSSGRDDKAGTTITPSSVERMMHDMAFRRKRFAHQVFTDHKCVDWIMIDIALLCYPFCAVVIASMWGYSAFGQGFDMFKTYMLAASFLVSQLQERILFMVTMVTQRPFDIGDILLLDGGPFRVRDFTTNHTYLDGTTALTVRNSVLLGDTVRNMTRGAVKDKVVMSLPVTTSNDTVVKVREALQGYARENPDEVEEGSVRTGWTCVEGGISKVMSVHWSYTFVVQDVNRFNRARTTVSDFVVASLGMDACLSSMGYASAGGGAFNDSVAVKTYMAHSMLEVNYS